MSRFTRPLMFALALSACTSDDGPRVPAQTLLIGGEELLPTTPELSPDGTRLAWAQPVDGQSRIFVGASDGSNPVRLSSGTWDYDPRWSPDGRWIAFAGESPQFDLWVVAAEGGEPRQLTTGVGVDAPMGWLPDGSGVVFSRSGAGEVRTLVAPLEGGAVRPLVDSLGGNQWVSLSPDGSRAAIELQRGAHSTIWLQDMAGGAARPLTTEGFELGRPTRRMWSPDGRSLVFASRRTGTTDLWIADVETGALRQLTSDVRNDNGHTWSPDGKWIAFVSDRGGQWDVWIVAASGGDAIRVTNDRGIEVDLGWYPDGSALVFVRGDADGLVGVTVPGGEPQLLVDWPGSLVAPGNSALSPDQRTLLFSGSRSGNLDIWSVPVAGGEPVPFAVSAGDDGQPQYSPDGSQVTFTSTRTGSADIWIMPAAGGEARRLLEWTSNEFSARWSPDGTQIAFISDREASLHDVWVVAPGGGAPRRVTTFNRAVTGFPEWSPDGKNLYVMTTGEHGAQLFRVSVAGGRPSELQIARSMPGGLRTSLSPDGAWYAYSSVVDGWAMIEITPTDGGAPRRITRRTERVWQPGGIWSPDGSKIAVSDWQFESDATTNVVELSVNDTTTRQVTNRPRSFESPELYLRDGRLVFSATGAASQIVKVSVAELLK